jgi:hypothetical protein
MTLFRTSLTAFVATLFILTGCPTAGDPGGEPEPEATPAPCEWPEDPLLLNEDSEATMGSFADGNRQFYAVDVDDNTGMFAKIRIDGLDPEPGDAPTIRICTPDGEVHAWGQGTPFWRYETSHASRTAAVLRDGGEWAIEVVPANTDSADFELVIQSYPDSPGDSTENDPNLYDLETGHSYYSISTFEYEGNSLWMNLKTECMTCNIALVGAMGEPGSAAKVRYTVYGPDGEYLTDAEDPAPESNGAEVHIGGGVIPGGDDGGLTVHVENIDGEWGDDYWTAFYYWIYEAAN